MPDQPDKLAIEILNVSKTFVSGSDRVTALKDVSIGIRQNEFFTLLGPSGCGKTTLLRLLAGFDFPSGGEVRLYGKDIAQLPAFKRPINTVFQNYALFPHMTVGQNIAFGLDMLKWRKTDVTERVDAMLQLVRMRELKDRRISQISGGQQQRVALARALAPQPKVLLLDEPLSALDYKLRKDMQIELKRLQHETGITFIFVTHDQEEALTMSDRIAVISSGRVLQIGSAHEIYGRPAERFVADFIGETNFLKGKIVAIEGATADVKLAIGRIVRAGLPEHFEHVEDVTVVIRPEHAEIIDCAVEATMNGTVTNVVYFGTDTHYHIGLNDGSVFMVRRQNGSVPVSYPPGTKVGVRFNDNAARVLRD